MAGLVLVCAMLGFSVWGWTRLGGAARVAIHFDAAGTPNGYASPVAAFGVMPVVALLLLGLFALIPRIDPRGQNLLRSEPAYALISVGALVLLAVMHALAVAAAVTGHLEPRVLVAVLAVFLAVTGNYFGKIRSNFFVGVRTPWTLSSELSWDRTHRLTGRLLVATGLICLVTTAVSTTLALTALIASVVAILPVVTVYSYLVWRADPARDGARQRHGGI